MERRKRIPIVRLTAGRLMRHRVSAGISRRSMRLWPSEKEVKIMNKQQLQIELNRLQVPPDSYSLSGGFPNEAFCLDENYGVWTTYYSERGQKTGEKSFTGQAHACDSFLRDLKRMLGIP
jgi:hypothetical protein